MIALCSKCYYIDEGPASPAKVSAKGVNQRQNPLRWERYNSALQGVCDKVTNRGFRMHNGSMFTYEQRKRGLSAYYDKATTNSQGTEKIPKQVVPTTRDMAAVLSALERLEQKTAALQAKIDMLQVGQELHLEDAEDLEETQRSLLDHIEEVSNTIREKADKILSATNAAKNAAYSIVALGTVALAGWALVWILASKLSATQKPKVGTLAPKRVGMVRVHQWR